MSRSQGSVTGNAVSMEHPFNTTIIHTRPMRTKHASGALKRQRRTFHPARHDPERWERENLKEATLLENSHDAQEREGMRR